jgi:hypothetical protein
LFLGGQAFGLFEQGVRYLYGRLHMAICIALDIQMAIKTPAAAAEDLAVLRGGPG